jgi:threonine/homoserine/homoserine lactone efflux protein
MHLLAVCVIAFLFGYVGSMPLAGPIAVLMLSRSAQQRFGEALRIGIGAGLAEGIYAGIAFWGFTTFLARNAVVVPISQSAATVVLTSLGVWFMFWHPSEKKEEERDGTAGTVMLGFSVSALNPTLLVTWSAAVAFLYSKGLGQLPPEAGVPFGACASAGIASWIACLVALLRRYHGKVPARVMTWIIRAMGVGLLGLGLWSGVQLYRWITVPSSRPAPSRVSLSCSPWSTGPTSPAARASRCSPTAITTSG